MSNIKLAPDSAKSKVLMTLFRWVFLGLGMIGLFNLGSLLLTGSIWVHSGTRANAQWLLLNATDAPEGFLWGLMQLGICLVLGVLAVVLFFFQYPSAFQEVTYLDVQYLPGQAPQETVIQPAQSSAGAFKPIRFVCQTTLAAPPSAIVAQIFHLEQWPSFQGYGPLPGIVRAEFEHGPTPDWVGTRIRVENADGSRHTEEVQVWDGQQLVLELASFSPPLAWLASHFVETWCFEVLDAGHTRVLRHFELYPHSFAGHLCLPVIARLLKQAVQRHLAQMAA